ncbi:putative alpha/beta hydrolase [Rhizodiscina lignyota]|uniref:Alpha/beta hydrolase n=1 Tax=Rhizodiscina lignyota TaxID=1504668 RepID=A0A9P4I868_9PEZI|nr:putative alpha/beta hydrolase [Rhizodiscina lignyota]
MAHEGILYVTMAPKPSLSSARFHDWYNNEHGPLRLRHPSIFRNGFRYRATDLDDTGKGEHEWMAIYDVTDMKELVKEPYTLLRQPPAESQRERDTKAQINISRKFFDLVKDWKSEKWTPLETVKEGQNRVIVQVSFYLKPGGDPAELAKWYTEEHVPMLSKVPGWLRSRRFVSSSIEPKDDIEYMALHEYEPENGLGGPEHKAASATDMTKKIYEMIKARHRRVFGLYYTFGQAPRDLTSLSSPDVPAETSTDGKTKSFPASTGVAFPAIESYITTPDGVEISYRLEGSWDQDAPLILLSNAILTEWGIWDNFVSTFLSKHSNYRILRYNTRGRYAKHGTKPINVDVLAGDIISLLDAVRVPKAALMIGVSLGGCTVLNASISNPQRVARFISCDTASSAVPGNDKAWKERIAIAEKQGATNEAGETIVGSELAELTVRRWFNPESYKKSEFLPVAEKVKGMVERWSLDGFKACVQALWVYDLKDKAAKSDLPCTYLAGEKDGAMPATMEKMSKEYGKSGAQYVVLAGAGHLPMVENEQGFLDEVEKFLKA